MRFGLIGSKVDNSFSKYIHHLFHNDDYFLYSAKESELSQIFEAKKFQGLNITKPFKKIVIKYLDELDDIARKTNSVNTIINEHGVLKGYNTDYDGFKYLLFKNKIDVKNKIVAILGTGGVSNTIETVMYELEARTVYKVSRKNQKNCLTYNKLSKKQIDIIVNATPRGMDQSSFHPLINLKKFKNLNAVIDLIANPFNTFLLQEAKSLNITAVNGLDMLIEQARLSEQLFQKVEIPPAKNELVWKATFEKYANIALIGMPYAGKSTIGFYLSKYLKKDFVDLDMLIEENEGVKITDFIKKCGENAFRMKEHQFVKIISFQNGEVISSGGGIITKKENIKLLKQNSFVVYIKRDIDLIEFSNNRPLSSNKKDYLKLLKEREKKYEKYADIIVENNKTIEDAVEEIARKFYEIINN